MLGYDWPRLHAALNDLPAALLLVAVLFDLAGAVTNRPVVPAGGLLDTPGRRGRRGAGGDLGPSGGGAHRPRRGGAPGDGDPRGAGPRSRWASSRCWRSGGSSASGGWEAPSGRSVLAASLGGVGVLLATAVYGGKLVFEHAAGIPTEVLAGRDARAGRRAHHHGAEGEATSTGPTSTRRRPRAAIRPQRRARRRHRRLRQAGRSHPCPRHAAAQGLT